MSENNIVKLTLLFLLPIFTLCLVILLTIAKGQEKVVQPVTTQQKPVTHVRGNALV